MVDIVPEAERIIAEKDYILDTSNFYEVATDSIHVKNDNFANPLVLFTLLHELAHRYQIVLLKLDSMDTPILEREANDIAIAALRKMGIELSPRAKRVLDRTVNASNKV